MGDDATPWPLVVLGTVSTIISQLPTFLVGALGVSIMSELDFGPTGLGLAVSSFGISAALLIRFLGRTVDRIGSLVSLRSAAAITATACLGVAVLANDWAVLVGFLVVAGAAHALSAPAANRLLARQVPSAQLGLALGVKQSGPPAASLLAGVSVPLLAVAFGWRWGFAAGGTLSLVLLIFLLRSRAGHAPTRWSATTPSTSAPEGLLGLRFALLVATAATVATATFYVDAAVSAGTGNGVAGLVLAAASLGAIALRIGSGIVCDRVPGEHMRWIGGMVIVGSSGYLLLWVGSPAYMAAGVFVALAGTWGYNAILWYSLLQASTSSPGSITGAVMPMALIGAAIGPSLFGAVVDAFSYKAGWMVCGVCTIVSAVLLIRQASGSVGSRLT